MISKKMYLLITLWTMLPTSIISSEDLNNYFKKQSIKKGLEVAGSIAVSVANNYRECKGYLTPLEKAELELKNANTELVKIQKKDLEADVETKQLNRVLTFCLQARDNKEVTAECKEILLRWQKKLEEENKDLPELEKKEQK